MISKASEYLSPVDVSVVVYHSPCHDGRGAAAAAQMYNPGIVQIKYDPNANNILDHTEMKEKLNPTDKIVFIDCAPPGLSELHRLRERYARVMVLDHHSGNEASLFGAEGCFFNNNKAGCMLAWEYFHPQKPLPLLLRIVGERDLGNFADPVNKYVGFSLIDKPPSTTSEMIDLINQGEEGVKTLAARGMELANELRVLIDQLECRFIPHVNLAGKKYAVLVIPMKNHRFISEVCEHMFETYYGIEFIMCHFPGENGMIRLSFRTNRNEVNVAEIAKLYKGNGHRQAAGAAVQELPEWAVDDTPSIKRRPGFRSNDSDGE